MHTDDMNDLVLMGLARDAAEAEARNCRDVIERLRVALKEAGDVIECYYVNTGINLGDASMMPFYEDTITKIDRALKEDK
jgi:hypothetical protein